MKAVVFYKHGGPEVLRYESRPQPKPGPHEVLVQVKACALNHLDIWTRQGLPGIKIPLPHILGNDVAGVVAAVGKGVEGARLDQRVVVAPGLNCGRCEPCVNGRDSLCTNFRILGFQVDGGYAEFVSVPERSLIPVSSAHSFEEWAAAPLVFLTAWHMLLTRGGLKLGETVLIHAGGSGIGSAAIQIAKLTGARVITTVGDPEKTQKAKALGADDVINYRVRDFAKETKRLTHDRGVDLVFEHIGPQTWTKSLASLAKGGRVVLCGATSGPQVELDLRFVYVKELSLHGCYMGSRHELLKIIALMEAKRLKPVVDTVFSLKDAAKAHQKMLSRDFFGKLVLRP